jgi:hypothetical protein
MIRGFFCTCGGAWAIEVGFLEERDSFKTRSARCAVSGSENWFAHGASKQRREVVRGFLLFPRKKKVDSPTP